MKSLEILNGKRIGIYIRKESNEKNFSIEYGRLQWLRYELEDIKGTIHIFTDEVNQVDTLRRLTYAVIDGEIDIILIWTIDELMNTIGGYLILQASLRSVRITSFCESQEYIDYMVDHAEDVMDEIYKKNLSERKSKND